MITTSTSIANRSNDSKISFILEHWIFQHVFSPIITLIPGTSSFFSPIQFRRNQDFSISSNLELKCNSSLSTNIKWTVSNCSSVLFQWNSIGSKQSLQQLMNSTFQHETLPYGIYQLNLTVSMLIPSSLTSTASAYIRITASGITVNLVPLGNTDDYQWFMNKIFFLILENIQSILMDIHSMRV